MRPIGLCSHCNGYGAGFTVERGLSCKKGGPVSILHNDTRDEAGDLVAMVFFMVGVLLRVKSWILNKLTVGSTLLEYS